jgi:hypothetical protein
VVIQCMALRIVVAEYDWQSIIRVRTLVLSGRMEDGGFLSFIIHLSSSFRINDV